MEVSFDIHFEPRNIWVGVHWDTGEQPIATGPPECAFPIYGILGIWICVIPCFPIHITFMKKKE